MEDFLDIIIRNEEQKDFRNVEYLTREAFWNLYVPGCDEHYLVHKMRDHQDFVKELDFVAVLNDQIIGNIMYTKSYLINSQNIRIETLTFGPLCILPKFQRLGVGTKLINHTVNIAKNNKIPAIIIYGDPHNYVKHGFKNGIDYNISDPYGKYPYGLLVLKLDDNSLNDDKWTIHCSDVFNINPKEAEEFDKNFPFKEKKWQYSQELFSMTCRAILQK